MIEAVVRDVRYTLRFLVKRPGFALTAVATIAIGLGTITVAFTAIDTVLYRGLLALRDVPGGGRVYVDDRGRNEGEASFFEYQAFASDVPSLDISATAIVTFGYRRQERPAELLFGLAVTPNHFELLDIDAAAGRTFEDAEGGTVSAVISDRFWRERLDGASLTGLTINLNGLEVPVLGVLPAEARDGIYDPSIWVRIDDWDALRLPPGGAGTAVNVFGRLRQGTTRAQANRELAAVSRELARTRPETNTHRAAAFRTFGDSAELRALRQGAAVALGIISIVLVIALFNLVGLLLARAVDREREMRLRGALGASRLRLVSQLVTESLVISALGGAVALLVARFSGVLLRSFALQAPMPQRLDLTVDWRVVAFTGTLVVGCGVVAGLLPARHAVRLGMAGMLGATGVAGSTRQSRLRTMVVGVQLAGATMLLAVAALLARSAILSSAAPVGFESERAVLVGLNPVNHGYTRESAEQLIDDVLRRVRGTAGVVAAAAADRVPFYVGLRWRMPAFAAQPCRPDDCPEVSGYRVSPDYFRAMRIPLRRGREFDGSAADAQSVVISETAAARFWDSRDPVGQWLTVGAGRRVQVIGVAADVLHRGLGERPEPYVYLPLEGDAFVTQVTLIVGTAADPRPLQPVVEAHLHALAPGVPAIGLTTMGQHLDQRARAGSRIVARFFLVCGGLGLFLALIGLAGSISYSVGQRTREFGIRAAVGATPASLRRLVLGGALRLGVVAIAVGLAAAYGLSRVIAAGVSGLNLESRATYGWTAAALLGIVSAAALIPAARAARSGPLAALRAD